MATVKKIKKAQNGDSTAYYKNLDKKYIKASNDAYKKHDVKGSFAAMSQAMKASANAERQKLKGKPGYDKMGFPVKKNKTGGKMTKAKDGKWIQKAVKGMRKDKPCTGPKFGSKTCPPGSKRYNLAKTFKKMSKKK